MTKIVSKSLCRSYRAFLLMVIAIIVIILMHGFMMISTNSVSQQIVDENDTKKTNVIMFGYMVNGDLIQHSNTKGESNIFCKTMRLNILNKIPIHYLHWNRTSKQRPKQQKLEGAHEYLSSLCNNPLINNNETIIIFVDSTDIIIQSNNINNIVSRFMFYDTNKLIIGQEKQCWPKGTRKTKFCDFENKMRPNDIDWIPTNTDYHDGSYINSGGIISRLSTACNIYNYIVSNNLIEKYQDNDQMVFHGLFYENNTLIGIDYYSSIFQNQWSYSIKDYQLKPTSNGNGIWFNKKTNQYPPFLHFNGQSKYGKESLFNKMYNETLNYLITNNITNKQEVDIDDGVNTDSGFKKYSSFCSTHFGFPYSWI